MLGGSGISTARVKTDFSSGGMGQSGTETQEDERYQRTQGSDLPKNRFGSSNAFAQEHETGTQGRTHRF